MIFFKRSVPAEEGAAAKELRRIRDEQIAFERERERAIAAERAEKEARALREWNRKQQEYLGVFRAQLRQRFLTFAGIADEQLREAAKQKYSGIRGWIHGEGGFSTSNDLWEKRHNAVYFSLIEVSEYEGIVGGWKRNGLLFLLDNERRYSDYMEGRQLRNGHRWSADFCLTFEKTNTIRGLNLMPVFLDGKRPWD